MPAVLVFHTLVFKMYWVLMESRIPLKPMLGELLHFSVHEQTQYNPVCCFLIL